MTIPIYIDLSLQTGDIIIKKAQTTISETVRLIRSAINSTNHSGMAQMVRYGLVSMVALSVDIGGLFIFTELLGINYIISASLSFILGLATNYLLSRLWVFDTSNVKSRTNEFIVFTLIGVTGLLLNDLIIWTFTDGLSLHYMVSKLISTSIVFFWNFFLRKYLIYNNSKNRTRYYDRISAYLKQSPYEFRWVMILAAIYTALFISIILIITPGFASNDSTDQYLQAIGSKPLNDWHPIGMTLMWRFLLTITAWKGSLVALQLLLLIIGLFFLSVSFFHQTKSRRISLIPILILLLPNVIGLIGYNWKDVQLAAALTLSSCLLYTVSIMKLSKTIRLTLVAAALLSCAYTLTLRTNAIFAALPIIYYATRLIYRTKAYWKLAMAALGITLLCMLPFLLLTKLADPAKGRIETSMMALDVVNITSPESIRKADLPIPLKNGLLRMSKCTHFGSGLNLNFFACESNFSDTSVYIKHHSTLKEYWLDVVKRNPRSYLLFKLESFMIFAFPPQNSQYIIDPHGNRFIDEGNVDSHVAGATQAYTINFGYSTASFLFKAWFYILTAIVLLLLSKKYPDKRFIQVLAISSLLYIASFAPSSVTPDYRYILWPVLAIFIAVSIMIRSKLDSSYIS